MVTLTMVLPTLLIALLAVFSLGNGGVGQFDLSGRPDLLECRVIVTGTDRRSRPDGLAQCVRQVAVRVTGRPDLADDPAVEAIVAEAPRLVTDLAYLDRMTDIPLHDEQGSRDRPFDLLAHVDPRALEQRLAAAGLRPWLKRPTLLAMITIAPRNGDPFRLTGDGAFGERQRRALLEAGATYGMQVALPWSERPGDGPHDGQVVLQGTLRWSEPDFGWVADWAIDAGGQAVRWQVRGVSFDAAFRSGVGGAARTLAAGN